MIKALVTLLLILPMVCGQEEDSQWLIGKKVVVYGNGVGLFGTGYFNGTVLDIKENFLLIEFNRIESIDLWGIEHYKAHRLWIQRNWIYSINMTAYYG